MSCGVEDKLVFVCASADSRHQRGDGGQQGKEIRQRRLTAVVPDENSWVRESGMRRKWNKHNPERNNITVKERGTNNGVMDE